MLLGRQNTRPIFTHPEDKTLMCYIIILYTTIFVFKGIGADEFLVQKHVSDRKNSHIL